MKGTHFKRLTAGAAALVLAASAIPECSAVFAANSVTYTVYSWNETEKKLGTTEKTITAYNEVSSYLDMYGDTFTGTYYIKKDVLISRRISVAKGGTLNLIVPEGVTLTLTKGLGCGYGKKDSTPTTLNIYGGGKIIATGDSKCAGIGGKDDEANGIISIHGTTIEATGGKHAAGIGGGEGGQDPDETGEKSKITIYAGDITASGGINGAGIGGGDEQPGARTYIYSGKIGAGSAKHGAGIGGGDEEGTCGVWIYGGTVTAEGGYRGAGIGAGEEGGNLRKSENGGGINILGGTVTATGGSGGAGIGGGYDEDMSGTINIAGDDTKITANGGYGSAGIGAGKGDSSDWCVPEGDMKGTITINCGEQSDIKVTGGGKEGTHGGGAGIGAGFAGNQTGKVYIKGGNIEITSGDMAAGIGGGRENGKYGGEGGDVYIGGGNITIYTINSFWYYEEKSQAIGSGVEDAKDGSVYISADNNTTGKYMRVAYMPYDKEDFRTASASDRSKKCHTRCTLKIEECNHKDYNGKSGLTATVTPKQHMIKCKYCGYTEQGNHDSETYCHCGYNSDNCWNVELRDIVGNEAFKVVKDKEFILPDDGGKVYPTADIPEQYYRRAGWTLSGDTSGKVYEQGEAVTVTRDSIFTTQRENLYKISFDGVQNCSIHAAFDGNETYAAEGEELVFGVEPDAGFSVNRVSYQVMKDYSNDNKDTAVPVYSDPIELQPQDGKYALTIPALEIPNNLIKVSAETVQDVRHTVGISSAFGGRVTADSETAEENDTVTLTVTPEAGFQLEKIRCRKSEGDVELTKVNDTMYTFKMPAEDVTVSAEFEYQPLMSITADSSKYYMNVFLPIADGKTISDYSAVFGDDVQTLTDAKLNGQACGKFTIQCAAKEMVDSNSLTIQIGEETAYSGMLSAEKYLKALTDDETYGNIAKAMLRYGAAAQTYFDYKTDCLANDGVEGYGLDSLAETEIANNSPSVEEYRNAFALSSSKYSGMNMTFDSDTSLLIAFEIKGDNAEAELEEKFENTAYEVTFETDNSGDFIIVKAANIPIKKLGDAIFAFSGANVKADDYLARIANNSEKSENLRNLCKALHAFYESAK